MVILEKTREKKKLSEDIVDTIALAKVAQVLSTVDLTQRFKWTMNNTDLDKTKKLEPTRVKKYWKCIA